VLSLDRTTHERLSGAIPLALRERSAAAFEAFERLPMPDQAEESWRYADYDVDLADLGVAEAPGESLGESTIEAALAATSGRIVLIDGHAVASGGDPVRTASAGDMPAVPAVPADLDRFAAAHEAFGVDAAVVTAGRGQAIEAPVFVDIQAVTPGVVSFPRLVVHAGEASQLSLVVHQRSSPDLSGVVVPRIEVLADAAANVELTIVQGWGSGVTAVAQQRLTGQRDSRITMAEAGLGGAFARLHLTVDLIGRGADARILGAYFGDDEQTLDYRYFMNHAAPNTTSNMFLKGAVAGEARSIFSGLIRIEEEGQGTNAHQTNRNLVLSDHAEAHSVPNLEILANDVRCGHGSSVGPLDDEQRYYLMSRGLSRKRSDRLQVKGFFEDALTRFPIQDLEPPLRTAVMERYERVVGR
jgi:Fe-S cluster assembly protein SufD